MKKTIMHIKTKLSMLFKKILWLLIFGAYFKYTLNKKYCITKLRLFKFSDWHLGCNYFIGYSAEAKKEVFIKTSGRFNLADREIDVLSSINSVDRLENKYFPKIIASNKQKGVAFLAIEFINGITLSKYLNTTNLRDHNFDLKIIKELNSILITLHEMSIIHRDIRPDNILLDQIEAKVILIDFAFAVSHVDKGLGEVQIIKKHPMIAETLGEEYKPDKLLWDDAYSIHKIAEKITPEYSEHLPNEHKNILLKIGEKTYEFKEKK